MFKGHFIAVAVLACFCGRTANALTPLILSGPCSVIVCPGYPPGTNPSARPYDRYPQLTFQVTNAPAGFSLIFDLASNASPPGLGAPSGMSVGQNMGIYSPTVLSGNDMKVYISTMNGLGGMSATNTTGIYGAGNNGNLPCGGISTASVNTQTGVITGTCCQNLRFSVSPGLTGTAYTAGYKDVTVCYADANTCTVL